MQGHICHNQDFAGQNGVGARRDFFERDPLDSVVVGTWQSPALPARECASRDFDMHAPMGQHMYDFAGRLEISRVEAEVRGQKVDIAFRTRRLPQAT
ncbi:MAG: hypothetical protein WBY94_14720 [Polyangiaceae bacterium]